MISNVLNADKLRLYLEKSDNSALCPEDICFLREFNEAFVVRIINDLNLDILCSKRITTQFLIFSLSIFGHDTCEYVKMWLDRRDDLSCYSSLFPGGLTFSGLKSLFFLAHSDYISYVRSMVRDGSIEGKCSDCKMNIDDHKIGNYENSAVICLSCFSKRLYDENIP